MQETNIILKKWTSDSLKIALVYPNHYAAMAGLTIQSLYHTWNKESNIICERFFLPSQELSTLNPEFNQQYQLFSNQKHGNYKPSQIPPIKSIENHMLLLDFDIIAFSVCYELDFKHILWILDNSRIPLKSCERIINPSLLSQDQRQINYPIVIAGGVAIRSNPLPVIDFLDAVFIGEYEPIHDKFRNAWEISFTNPLNKDQNAINQSFLTNLCKIPGFWVPSKTNYDESLKIKRIFAENIDEISHPTSQIIPRFSEYEESSLPFHEAFFVEINRGCPHFCNFCLTGAQNKPFRNRSLSTLKEIIQKGVNESNPKRIVLIGSSVTNHPDFTELCEFLISQNIEFSIPSVRIEGISEKNIKLLKKSGMNTITFAPETGSERLRGKMGKKISNQSILAGSKLILNSGFPFLKMYFLYGLPEENDDDIESIIDLISEILAMCKPNQKLKISLNPFIPKPHTPFEIQIHDLMDSSFSSLKSKFKKIQIAFQRNPQVKLETLSLEEAFLQLLFSLGDKNFSSILLDYYKSNQKIKSYVKSIKNSRNPYSQRIYSYLDLIAKQNFGEHPWNVIDQCLSIQILDNLYQKSKQ